MPIHHPVPSVREKDPAELALGAKRSRPTGAQMPTRSYSYFTPVLDCGSEDHEVLVSVHVDSPNSSSLQAPEAFRRFRIDGVEHHAGALVIQSG